MIEPLDRRILLAVNFKFTIVDPTGQYNAYHTKLQALLNAAGGEWSSHLSSPNRDVTLDYDVSFSNDVLQKNQTEIVRSAPRYAEVVATDARDGTPVYQVGTALEIINGVDPNGTKSDAGIVIFGRYISQFFMDPNTNARTAPIPAGSYDGYTLLLHEIGHTLGFLSGRNAAGAVPPIGEYTFDQHVTTFPGFPGFYTFGTGFSSFDPTTGNFVVDPSSDNAFQVYGESVPLEIGYPSHLGTGRISPGAFQANPDILIDFFLVNPNLRDDLSTDLMGGPVLPGERKTISKLDLAVLKDSGTPVNLNLNTKPEGIYVIDGTGLSDTIDVTLTNGNLIVRVNDAVQAFDPTQSNLISSVVINGLNGNDTIIIHGDGPAVVVNGGAGNDTIIGGPKADTLNGGGGNDVIYGGKGGDVIHGGDGNDTVYGQGGGDRIYGDAGSDHLDGGAQTDRIHGGSGNDTLIGGTENDFLYGDAGNDLISGAGGKDRMDGGSGADSFYGGNGNDIVDYSHSPVGIVATIDGNNDDGAPGEHDNIVEVENILGSPFDDVIVGDEGRNSLMGGDGNDTIDGGGGHDTLEGNAGNDVLIGSGGHDSLLGGEGDDTITGSSGLDRMFGEGGNDLLISNDGEVDTLDGGTGNDRSTSDATDVLNSIEVPTIV